MTRAWSWRIWNATNGRAVLILCFFIILIALVQHDGEVMMMMHHVDNSVLVIVLCVANLDIMHAIALIRYCCYDVMCVPHIL